MAVGTDRDRSLPDLQIMRVRKPNRLSGYDYAQPGAYFITTVTKGRHNSFGEIEDGKVQLNRYGNVINEQWKWLQEQYSETSSDEFVVMPNHFHGILNLRGPTQSEISV